MKRILCALVMLIACTIAGAQKHSSFNFMLNDVNDKVRCFEFEPLDNSQISRLFYEVMGKSSHLYDVDIKGGLLNEDGAINYVLYVPQNVGGVDVVTLNAKVNVKVKDRRMWAYVDSFYCKVISGTDSESFVLPQDYDSFSSKLEKSLGKKRMAAIQNKASDMIDSAFEEMYRCWWDNYYSLGVSISR